jgi:hypothetical protein
VFGWLTERASNAVNLDAYPTDPTLVR